MLRLRSKMKVGPKGQVVIPKGIRDAAQIHPGTEVIFETTDNGIHMEKTTPEIKMEDVFEAVAKSGASIKTADHHMAYEGQMEHRWKKRRGLK